MDKRNKILAGIFAVQIVIILFVFLSGNGESPTLVELLPGMVKEEINRLEIADDGNNAVVLQKDASGWFLAQADMSASEDKAARHIESTSAMRFPVDQQKAETLVDKLAALRSSRLVTRTRSSHERLQVAADRFSRKITIAAKSGRENIYLGVAPNYKTIHVRKDDDTDVYLVQDLALWEAPADAVTWWPNHYVQFDTDAATRFEVKNSHGVFSLEKDEAGNWRLAGKQTGLNEETLKEFLDRIKEISLVDFVTTDKQRDFGIPAGVLTIDAKQHKTNLTIWPKDDKSGDYVVKASTSALYARAGSYEIEHLLNRKQEDFVAAGK